MMKRSSDYAKIVESVENPLTLNAQGTYGFNFTTSLSEFQRAQEVAHAYKYYRCAKVELLFVPYHNVSGVAGGAATHLPQLYFTVDRVANHFIVPTEPEMQSRGVSPKVFTRKLRYSWKPNLLQNIQLESWQGTDGGVPAGINTLGAINSVPLFNKWLPTQQSFSYNPLAPLQANQVMVQPATNPYALRYYGAAFVIDQENGHSMAVGDLITKVTWEFKGPRALLTNDPQPQTVVSPGTSGAVVGYVPNTQPTDYP